MAFFYLKHSIIAYRIDGILHLGQIHQDQVETVPIRDQNINIDFCSTLNIAVRESLA